MFVVSQALRQQLTAERAAHDTYIASATATASAIAIATATGTAEAVQVTPIKVIYTCSTCSPRQSCCSDSVVVRECGALYYLQQCIRVVLEHTALFALYSLLLCVSTVMHDELLHQTAKRRSGQPHTEPRDALRSAARGNSSPHRRSTTVNSGSSATSPLKSSRSGSGAAAHATTTAAVAVAERRAQQAEVLLVTMSTHCTINKQRLMACLRSVQYAVCCA
jgi:hypothetical protein